MTRLLVKEVCSCCQKNICLGQSVTECEQCKCIIHTRCFKKSSFATINSKQYCTICKGGIDIIYNPFESLCRSYSENDYSDRHYNSEIGDCFDDLSKISSLLNSCSRFENTSVVIL